MEEALGFSERLSPALRAVPEEGVRQTGTGCPGASSGRGDTGAAVPGACLWYH